MKTTILSLFVMLLTITSNVQAEDACIEALATHVDLIEKTEEYIAVLAQKPKSTTGYEITELQKMLTKRYKSLKAFQSLFTNEENAVCKNKTLSNAVAIFDCSALAQSVFANDNLRRIVVAFTNYKAFDLTDLLKNYKKFTKHTLIEKTIQEIKDQEITLPSDIDIIVGKKRPVKTNTDIAMNSITTVVANGARLWGFISDKLKWRQGRLRENMEARELVKSNLRPLDLIYETRNYTLSNFTIPGHWGHVGVWLGTKEELIALGIWDLDFFKHFRPFVEAGKNIVEIRKEGLNFQSVDTFINLDEIAITRVKDIEQRAYSVYSELSLNINKKYDFKFNSRTADKITCAELIAFSYGDIKWPETKTVFQYNLRPDDMALLTLDPTSPLEFILYLKGNKDGSYQNLDFKEWKKLFSEETLKKRKKRKMKAQS